MAMTAAANRWAGTTRGVPDDPFLARWLPSFEADQRSTLTVAVGCTGGQHRSVWFVERLAERFVGDAGALIRHREIETSA